MNFSSETDSATQKESNKNKMSKHNFHMSEIADPNSPSSTLLSIYHITKLPWFLGYRARFTSGWICHQDVLAEIRRGSSIRSGLLQVSYIFLPKVTAQVNFPSLQSPLSTGSGKGPSPLTTSGQGVESFPQQLLIASRYCSVSYTIPNFL